MYFKKSLVQFSSCKQTERGSNLQAAFWRPQLGALHQEIPSSAHIPQLDVPEIQNCLTPSETALSVAAAQTGE